MTEGRIVGENSAKSEFGKTHAAPQPLAEKPYQVAFPAYWLALAGAPKNQVQPILRSMQHKALQRITKQRTGVA